MTRNKSSNFLLDCLNEGHDASPWRPAKVAPHSVRKSRATNLALATPVGVRADEVRTIDDRGEIGRNLSYFVGNMTNLAEQISRLANPAPVFHDPEDLDDGISSILNQL